MRGLLSHESKENVSKCKDTNSMESVGLHALKDALAKSPEEVGGKEAKLVVKSLFARARSVVTYVTMLRLPSVLVMLYDLCLI